MSVSIDPNSTNRPSPICGTDQAESMRSYPAHYRLRPVCEQLLILTRHFPALDLEAVLFHSKNIPLPLQAEGLLVVPKYEAIAGSYINGLGEILNCIAIDRALHNWAEKIFSSRAFQHTEKSTRALSLISMTQNGPFTVFAAQSGLRHRSRSIAHAREQFAPLEFGLGPYEVAAMLLTHPDRLMTSDDLFVDCAGMDVQSSCVPFFCSMGGRLCFHVRPNMALAYCGSASGFLPQ